MVLNKRDKYVASPPALVPERDSAGLEPRSEEHTSIAAQGGNLSTCSSPGKPEVPAVRPLPALDSASWLQAHAQVVPEALVAISAKDGTGMNELLGAIETVLLTRDKQVEAFLPYGSAGGELLNEVHKAGSIVHEEYLADCTRVVARVPPSLLARLQPFVRPSYLQSSSLDTRIG
mmetsp:Transcript_27873/g.73528  ORF Transcript_27873/g.73528 Transcript_27873/m.73528 type:complete len:175 (+) Transcript_27873:563-1087(+)